MAVVPVSVVVPGGVPGGVPVSVVFLVVRSSAAIQMSSMIVRSWFIVPGGSWLFADLQPFIHAAVYPFRCHQ